MLDKTDEVEKPSFVAERSAFGKQDVGIGFGHGYSVAFPTKVLSRELDIFEFLWVKMLCTLKFTKRHHDAEVLDIS